VQKLSIPECHTPLSEPFRNKFITWKRSSSSFIWNMDDRNEDIVNLMFSLNENGIAALLISVYC
jgi:hypothetical protein